MACIWITEFITNITDMGDEVFIAINYCVNLFYNLHEIKLV